MNKQFIVTQNANIIESQKKKFYKINVFKSYSYC